MRRGLRAWELEGRRREAERQRNKCTAAEEVGPVTERELLLIGAVAYWCEGTKDKPYARREKITFTNSDAVLIRLFVSWLDLIGVPADQRRYRISIHESADVESAHRYWASEVGVPRQQLARPTLKTHRPRTNRLNVGTSYHGCLVITVLGSAELYQRVEGLMRGIDRGTGPLTAQQPEGGREGLELAARQLSLDVVSGAD